MADGSVLSQERLLQNTIVVNYWAEWCKPCAEEIPELNSLRDQVAPTQLVFGINFDNVEGEELIRQVDKLGIEFPVFANNPSESLGLPKPSVLPTTYILNPQGQIIETLVGPQTEKSLMSKLGR